MKVILEKNLHKNIFCVKKEGVTPTVSRVTYTSMKCVQISIRTDIVMVINLTKIFSKHMNDIIENSKDQKKGKRQKAREEETVVRAYV